MKRVICSSCGFDTTGFDAATIQEAEAMVDHHVQRHLSELMPFITIVDQETGEITEQFIP